MKCPKCGEESAEGSAFCGSCGYDFSSDNIMNTLDAAAEKEKKQKRKKPAFAGEKKENKGAAQPDPLAKKKLKIMLCSAAAVAAVIVLLVVIFSVSPTEGEKVFANVPIGRDIAYAESKTEKTFELVSKYDAFRGISSFDGVCESEGSVKIEGAHFPEWAAAVRLNSENTIEQAEFYDFSQLKKSWKGRRMSKEIAETNIEFGMSIRTVERKMGFKPYTIIKNIDNTASYVYRYYYPDETSGNDVVCNFVVVFNDADGSVRDVYVQKIDYFGFMAGFRPTPLTQ